MADVYRRKTLLKKSDFQLELRSQIWYVYLLAFKHCKKRKKQMMLDLIVQKEATTPNIVRPIVLGVVAPVLPPVLAVVCKRMQ